MKPLPKKTKALIRVDGRASEEAVTRLRDAGINISAVIRQAIEDAARKVRGAK
jgi:post-segregation antitoxin (ccd killing protein)